MITAMWIVAYLAIGVAVSRNKRVLKAASGNCRDETDALLVGMIVCMWPIVFIIAVLWAFGWIVQRIGRKD